MSGTEAAEAHPVDVIFGKAKAIELLANGTKQAAVTGIERVDAFNERLGHGYLLSWYASVHGRGNRRGNLSY